MTQVLDFAQMKKNKVEKTAPTKSAKGINAPEASTESKYVLHGDIQLSFGGAFERDLIKNLNERTEQVIGALVNSYKKAIDEMGIDFNDTSEGNVITLNVEDSFKVISHEKALALAATLETVEQLNAIFDNDSIEALIGMSKLVFAIVAVSYTHLDLLRMQKNNYYMVNVEIEELLSNLNDAFVVSEADEE